MRETKDRFTTQDIVYGGMFVALMAVGAFIKIMIPLGPWEVTFSLQFFFALMAGFLLGARLGFFSVLTYLIFGLCGMPIFAHGGGPAYLLKPTFGFLIGFAGAAFVAGKLYEMIQIRNIGTMIAAAFCGEMAYYACGLIYYYFMTNIIMPDVSIGIAELLSVWFLSTVIPDFMLAVGASVVAARLMPLFLEGRVHRASFR
ncbi:MAG: biotin transporter BioY [Lachnospiraceae bacterium]|nr:biotin transporter BioY [Lachnospiraceae bacterium]